MVKRTIIFRIAVAALAALLTLALIACDNGTSNTNPQNTLTDEANEAIKQKNLDPPIWFPQRKLQQPKRNRLRRRFPLKEQQRRRKLPLPPVCQSRCCLKMCVIWTTQTAMIFPQDTADC